MKKTMRDYKEKQPNSVTFRTFGIIGFIRYKYTYIWYRSVCTKFAFRATANDETMRDCSPQFNFPNATTEHKGNQQSVTSKLVFSYS